MILPERLKTGDIIGVVAPSNPVIDENIEEVKKAIPDAKDYYLDSLSLSVSTHIGPGSLAIALSKEI